MKKGIFLILLSSVSFGFTDMFAKLCKLPEIEKNLFMVVLAFFFAIGLLFVTKKKIIINGKKTVLLLIIRSLLGLVASVAYLYALSHLTLADATLLNKTAPFFVVAFSIILFREKINKRLILALIVAALGTVFVIKPTMNYTFGATSIGLLAGVFSAAAYVSIKYLKDYTNPETIAISFCVVSIIVSIPLMLVTRFIMPSLTDMLYLLGMGVTVALGQYALSMAYSVADASKISIYTYAEIIIASLLGLIIWHEYLGIVTILGGLLIIAGGVINYNNEDEIPYDM